jgi:hypothetical protein
MPANKISSFQSLYAPLTVPLAGGQSYILPTGQGIVGTFGAAVAGLTGYNLTGQYLVNLGPFSDLQMFDSNLGYWRNLTPAKGASIFISSDGTNYRIVNSTGCPVAAFVTGMTGGTPAAGLNSQSVVASAGGSTWNAIFGGALATMATTIIATGSNYQSPPQIIFTPPTNQGSTPYIIPTATAVLTNKSISSVTWLSNGAGLVALPNMVVINAPGDTLGSGASLAPSGSLTTSLISALYPTSYGTPLTVAPALSFTVSTSTLTAQAVMNFTMTGASIGTAGASLGSSMAFMGMVPAWQVTGTSIGSNIWYDKQAVFPRTAVFTGFTMSTGAISQAGLLGGSLGLVIRDPGYGIQTASIFGAAAGFAQGFLMQVAGAAGGTSTQAIITANVGATNDQCIIQPL